MCWAYAFIDCLIAVIVTYLCDRPAIHAHKPTDQQSLFQGVCTRMGEGCVCVYVWEGGCFGFVLLTQTAPHTEST